MKLLKRNWKWNLMQKKKVEDRLESMDFNLSKIMSKWIKIKK